MSEELAEFHRWHVTVTAFDDEGHQISGDTIYSSDSRNLTMRDLGQIAMGVSKNAPCDVETVKIQSLSYLGYTTDKEFYS